ncbi:MAG: PDZ domain-containing protein [Deltaproteobacteria bacterium]|nr:MAG: PDZ domain-containing protein [Deltaproteobacteria bacterium]
MERRDFLSRVAASLALAMTPSLEGCATVGGPDLRALAAAEPATLGSWLRARTLVIQERAWDSELVPYLLDRGADRGLVGDVLTALWSTSTFRDMPQEVQRLPEVQRWMLELGPTLARAAFGAADLLDTMPETDLEVLDAVIEDEEDPIARFAEALGQRGQDAGIADERREQSIAVMRQVEWRMKKQKTRAVLQGLVDRVDRVCKRAGFERSEWRAVLAEEEEAWSRLRPAVEGADEASLAAVVDRVPEDLWSEPLATTGGHLGLWMEAPAAGGGVRVAQIGPGSPAEAAGLQVEDIIERVDGVDVGPDELVAVLCAKPAGEAVRLDVRRGKEALTLNAVPEAGPGDRMARVALTPEEREEFRAISSAYRVFRVGLGMLQWGAISFAIGLPAMLVGGLMGSGAGVLLVVGGVLTVGGVLLMIISLFVLAISGIAMESEKQRWLERRRRLRVR